LGLFTFNLLSLSGFSVADYSFMSAQGSEPGEKQHTPPATPDHFSHGDHDSVLPRHLALPTTTASCPTYAQWMSTLFGSVVNYVLAPATDVAVPPVVVPALEEHELGTDEMVPVQPHTQSTPHSSAGSVRIVHDVVILNANPLVASLHNDNRPHHTRAHASISTPVSELPFHVEQKELTRALKSTHAPARLHFHHFSVASLGEELTKCPTVLSLNGHGFVRDGSFADQFFFLVSISRSISLIFFALVKQVNSSWLSSLLMAPVSLTFAICRVFVVCLPASFVTPIRRRFTPTPICRS
jgi:hypothetical protein